MNQVSTVIRKEWEDVLRNKTVLSVVIIVPLVMTALPIVMLFVMGRTPVKTQDLQEMGQMLNNPIFAGMSAAEAMQSSIASMMLILFLMMPLMVPVTIAAYSIVGEKVSRSLEPLLATPISTIRLLVAKGLAAAVPGIAMAWICYVVFLVFARFLSASDRVFAFFVDPMWLIAMFVLSPLLTIMAVNVGIIVSSRTSDPRSAEQLGSLVVLPLLFLLFGPMVGLIMLNSTTFWICSVVVALVDVGLTYLGVALFQRETILTRWK
jgi:ABC-2 type transport system permease protein